MGGLSINRALMLRKALPVNQLFYFSENIS
jgi:hypothetical protein